jgi:hypothetical protein
MREGSNADNTIVDFAGRCVVDEKITNVETMETMESMSTFSGDDNVSLKSWLSEFEQMSNLRDWTDAQRGFYVVRRNRSSNTKHIQVGKI